MAHQKEGIEAVHLHTGRTLCKVDVPSHHEPAYYITNLFIIIYMLTSNLQFHLLEGGIHADINGDGVLLDHVQVHIRHRCLFRFSSLYNGSWILTAIYSLCASLAVGGNVEQGTVVIGSMEVLKPCWAVATTGVPVGEQLFNVSTCHHAAFNFLHYGEHSQNFTDTRLMCTATASRSGNGSFRRKQHGRISRLHWV